MRPRPGTKALLPQPVARLVALAALAAVGALEWQRLVAGLSSGRALLWVVAAVGAAGLVLASERLNVRVRTFALPVLLLVALFAGYWLSGPGLDYLKPKHWDELVAGLGNGLQALGTVRLPYASADPWPRVVLELLGTELLILAGLLTFWPRVSGHGTRWSLAPGGRGYPFLAVAVLLAVVISPIISLGGSGSSLLLGILLAALTVAFLWLERLPLRPGLGVAGLLALALFGALPLAAAADRGEPWFDYRSFAESLGPDDPVRFSWTQSYGPIGWPRDGNEIMRVKSGKPLYWKARNLDVFNGTAWTTRSDPVEGDPPYEPDLPADYKDRSDWTREIEVSIRRMRITDVIGAGTTMSVDQASRNVEPGISPGTWDAPSILRRGDSYTARVYVASPSQGQLADATSGAGERQRGERTLSLPLKPSEYTSISPSAASVLAGTSRGPITTADVRFAPWDGRGIDFVTYPAVGRSEFGNVDAVMKRTLYSGTWALSKRLREGAKTPMDYVRAVDEYLSSPSFVYVERPPAPPNGIPPLEYFLTESHAGYCQHYAGAMALLLRMAGIPARVVTGFSPGGYSSRKEAWIVRDTDAHAWVEVWFDQFGWVTMDPTPDATPARSQIASLSPLPGAAPPAAAADTGAGDAAANTDRPNISLRPELRLGTGDGVTAGAGDGGAGRWWLWPLLLVVLAGAGLAVALWLRRPRGLSSMDRAIFEVEDALRRVGRPVTTGTTMTQLERRLGSYSPEVAEYLRALAAGRYAPVPAPLPRSGRRALRRALAQGLGFGGGLRALWALPPRWQPRAPRTLEVDRTVRVRG
ncbi:MAG TPA: transglutaminase-like domain-containing protein [Solirubrobacter sp.]|nr:transglutaminase-like domain-containing protein [Solirubrobacter sp.]